MKMMRTKFVTVSLMTLAMLLLGGGVARAETATNIINGYTTNVVGTYYVGNTGPFNVLIVTNAGILANTGNGFIGNAAGASNNSALVTGSGSVWSNNGSLFLVGFSGAANQLTIQSGGQVVNNTAYVGYNASASNNTVVVDNARWQNNNNFQFGNSSVGNSLIITNGGVVAVVSTAYLGYNAGADNNSALVTGSGSVWTNSGTLMIGFNSAGNSLTITNSGAVFATDVNIGFNAGATNNQIALAGGNLTAAGTLDVRRGTLALNGGALDVNTLLATNNTAGATNSFFNFNSGTLTTRAGAQIVLPTGSGINLGNTAGQTATWNMLGGTNSITLVSGSTNTLLGSVAGASANILVTGASTVWTNSGQLVVGYATNANNNQLTISNGGKVYNTKGDIGYDGASNSVLVTGANSLWKNSSGGLVVGDQAAGNQLTITNGATVAATGYATIGNATIANNNSVLVTGSGSAWTNTSGQFYVGNYGSGNSLTIANGGLVQLADPFQQNFAFFVGQNASASNNSVLVTGSGSTLKGENWTSFYMGYSGSSNTLTIADGGLVQGGAGLIGMNGGANNNSVLVTGTNSQWNLASFSDLQVGHDGNGNSLTITNGGQVNSGISYIGQNNGNNNSVLVTGTNSIWNINNGLRRIGTHGSGNSLTIAAGGHVTDSSTAESDWLQLGYYASSSNNSLTVTGAGSWLSLTNSSSSTNLLYIGYAGPSNSVTASAGGQILLNGTNDAVYLGYSTGAANNALTVTGTNSLLKLGGSLNVGYASSGNQMTIANGGVVSNTAAFIGYSTATNTVTVTGPGARWNSSGDLNLGYGTGVSSNQLSIANGGMVVNVNGWIGVGTNTVNNTASVTGSGALWNNSGDLAIGAGPGANGNQLSIANGGVVSNVNGWVGYTTGASNNTVTVTGSNSLWNNSGTLYIGYGTNANNNQLTISNGGQVQNTTGDIGNGGASNTILVTGTNTLWQNVNNLYVGNNTAGNTLTISNGSRVLNDVGYVGNTAGASNNSVLVTGSGSVWSNSGTLYVGNSGSYNQMTITNGAQVFSGGGYVGNTASASNNSVVVTGGSVWSNSGALYVGNSGNYNQMTVSSGSRVISAGGKVGFGGQNNSVLVTDTSSVWSNTANLAVRSGNSLTISNGAAVTVAGDFVNGGNLVVTEPGSVLSATNKIKIDTGGQLTIAAGAHVFGAIGSLGDTVRALVTGSGSVWSNSGTFSVGDGGSDNQLTVSNGAAIYSANAYLCSPNAFGMYSNRVTVTGTGSVWNNSGNLVVGDQGGLDNSLTITNGGAVVVGGTATIGSSGANGNQITVAGGSLAVTNAGATGTLNVFRGTLTMNGGTISADRFLATNGASSVVSFNGGTLHTGGSTVNNGTTFAVGDGSQAATLSLQGGTHSFANGLTLSSNATLTGTGTLLAPLTLGGGATLSPGHSPGLLVVSNNLTLNGSSTFLVELAGYAAGSAYDQLIVTGLLTNNDALLAVSLLDSFTPTNGAQFVIMNNASSMVGAFSGAPEGSSNNFGSAKLFSITYAGGAGSHDIILTAIPEPGVLALVVLLGGAFVGWRRFRRWNT